MTLTKLQKEALQKLSTTIWRSAHELKAGLGTLRDLVNEGFAESKNELGYFSMPFTAIKFRKLEKESESESRVLKRRRKIKRRKK